MKRYTFLILSIISLIFSALTSSAVPFGYSISEGNYIVVREDLSKFSAGVLYSSIERKVNIDGIGSDFNFRGISGYVGYDIAYFITLFAGGGSGKAELGNGGYGDEKGLWLIGGRFNFLDHEISQKQLLIDRIRITAEGFYGDFATEILSGNITWEEVYGNIILSILYDADSNPLLWPQAIGLSGGIVYSDLISSSFDENDKYGLAFGVDVFLTEKVSLSAHMQRFDQKSGYMLVFSIRL